jgi:hypothetical protein
MNSIVGICSKRNLSLLQCARDSLKEVSEGVPSLMKSKVKDQLICNWLYLLFFFQIVEINKLSSVSVIFEKWTECSENIHVVKCRDVRKLRSLIKIYRYG